MNIIFIILVVLLALSHLMLPFWMSAERKKRDHIVTKVTEAIFFGPNK